MRRFLLAPIVACALLGGLPDRATARETDAPSLTRAPIGTPIVVTPGQEFYAEIAAEPVPAVRLSRPFDSSMPGSMGLPFDFAIDTDVLVEVFRSKRGWRYFVPPDHKFRASHALLGSLLRGADTVGLRIGPTGAMEWFVDNSLYARKPTLWTRPLRPGDPDITLTQVGVMTEGSMDRLIYVGLSGASHAKIRLEKISGGRIRHDEFIVALNKVGKGIGAIKGAQFTIEVTSTQAVVTMIKAMTSDLGEIYRAPSKPIAQPAPAT